jgi:hypothetical protein
MAEQKTPVHTIFYDKDGKLAVAQRPNLPVITWFITMLLAFLIKNGRGHTFFDVISFGAIFTWAWLEIFHGKSYFRRVLGLVVMIVVVYDRVH